MLRSGSALRRSVVREKVASSVVCVWKVAHDHPSGQKLRALVYSPRR